MKLADRRTVRIVRKDRAVEITGQVRLRPTARLHVPQSADNSRGVSTGRAATVRVAARRGSLAARVGRHSAPAHLDTRQKPLRPPATLHRQAIPPRHFLLDLERPCPDCRLKADVEQGLNGAALDRARKAWRLQVQNRFARITSIGPARRWLHCLLRNDIVRVSCCQVVPLRGNTT